MPRNKDVEKEYVTKDVVAKLRRLADALEAGKPFAIQIDGERVHVPPTATVEFEYQREGGEAEIEIELSWKARPKRKRRAKKAPAKTSEGGPS